MHIDLTPTEAGLLATTVVAVASATGIAIHSYISNRLRERPTDPNPYLQSYRETLNPLVTCAGCGVSMSQSVADACPGIKCANYLQGKREMGLTTDPETSMIQDPIDRGDLSEMDTDEALKALGITRDNRLTAPD